MKMQILCRGSVKEGLGHLLRTRTFARHAQAEHELEVLAVAEPEVAGLLSELKCPVRRLDSDGEAVAAVAAFSPDVLVFDTLWVAPRTFQALREQAFLTASISPVFDHVRHIDLLFTRLARVAPVPGVTIHGGLPYAIFNDRCLVIDEAAYERNVSMAELPVAVCMGGADAANKTLHVLDALAALEEPMTVWVLLGEGYAHSYNGLVDTMRGRLRHEVILAKTNRSMWRVMSNCAVALLAGGLTTVESIHAGLPSINLFERAEHRALMSELIEEGVAYDGGLFSEGSLGTAMNVLRGLNARREELRAMRRRTRGRTDTEGPARVLREIEQALLRKALRNARGRAAAGTGGGVLAA